MKVAIDHLTISNFKGIKSLALPLDSRSATISGRNATGKTSVYDAFLWLLFGKDSTGASRFDVKPLDASGERVTGLATEVEARLIIDGKPVNLKRALIEKWRKVAGSPDPIYDRDETAAWIDEVPVKLEKEYQPFIQQICGDEETFKQLTVHGAFMQLPWEQRRRMLLEVSGQDVDPVILARPEFKGIPALLNGKGPEDTKKRLKEQQKKHNDDLKMLPARIDEQRLSRPSITPADIKEANANIARLNREIEMLDDQLAGTEVAYKQAADLIAKQRSLSSQLSDRQNELRRGHNQHLNDLNTSISALEGGLSIKRQTLQSTHDNIAYIQSMIARKTQEKDDLLVQWETANNIVYTPPVLEGTCPTCSQPFPADRLDHIRDAHKAAFDADQDAKLARINETGKEIAAWIRSSAASIAELQIKSDKLTDVIADLEEQIAKTQGDLAKLPAPPSTDDDPQCQALQAQIDVVKSSLDQQSSDDGREAYQTMRKNLQAQIKDWTAKVSQQAMAEMVDKRIEDLEAQKREIGQKLALIDRDLDLLSAYVSARCEAMEGSINAMFDTIRWKLFELQKNGEYADVCRAIVNGVSYESTLNNAARINAGIEMIRVLSKAKDTSVPCFVDNVEAVNRVAQTGGQMVLLRVTEDTELTLTKEA
ncbi:MAG: AAA family ATPase [Eubacteriales bacterium]|nr:AAA family ATPase [Eubacteriales bacterium]